jgi:hypothetical protein
MNKISALILSLAMSAPMGAYAVGAIAVDDVEGDAASDVGFNIVGGFDSEKEAKAAALKECKAAGNKNCKIGVWYTKCGAYASSKTSYGYGTGSTKAVASAKAIEGCDDKACKIVVADCE